jgi:hypothetical protein
MTLPPKADKKRIEEHASSCAPRWSRGTARTLHPNDWLAGRPLRCGGVSGLSTQIVRQNTIPRSICCVGFYFVLTIARGRSFRSICPAFFPRFLSPNRFRIDAFISNMDTMSATGAASFGASSGNKKAVHVKVCVVHFVNLLATSFSLSFLHVVMEVFKLHPFGLLVKVTGI